MRSLAKNVIKADCEEQATTFGIRFLFKNAKPREWQQSVNNFRHAIQKFHLPNGTPVKQCSVLKILKISYTAVFLSTSTGL